MSRTSNSFKNELFFLLLFLLSFQSLKSQVSDEQAQTVVSAWKAAKQSIYNDAKIEPECIIEAAKNYRSFLAGTPDTSLQRHLFEEGGEELIDYTLAKAWAKTGNYENSLNSLTAAASQAGIFLHSTRNPAAFANDVFALHSEIMANTGKVVPIANSGYEVFAARSDDGVLRYAFVYEPEGSDEGGVKIDDLAETDQRQMIGLIEPGSDGYHLVDSAQVIGKRDHISVSAKSSAGALTLIFSGVVKIIEYKGELKIPVVHPSARSKLALHIADGKIEQPLRALERAEIETTGARASDAHLSSSTSDQFPLLRTGKSRNRSELREPTQNEPAVSQAWWGLVVVLIVASTGFLWLLFRGRKSKESVLDTSVRL